MTSKINKNIIRKKKSHVWLLLVLFLLVVFDMSPFGGNIAFYAKWVECGQKPVQSSREPRYGGGNLPTYVDSPTFEVFRFSPELFCTPRQAELAGYSTNMRYHRYPHLTTDEANQVIFGPRP